MNLSGKLPRQYSQRVHKQLIITGLDELLNYTVDNNAITYSARLLRGMDGKVDGCEVLSCLVGTQDFLLFNQLILCSTTIQNGTKFFEDQ